MRRFVAGLAVAFFVLAASCSGDSTGPRSEDLSGTYTLRTVNGSSLPFVIVQVGADKVEVTADAISVVQNSAAAGSFTQLTTLRLTQMGAVSTQTVPDAGTYTRSGTAITFTFNSGDSGNGTVSTGAFTVVVEGFSLVYRK